MNMPRVQKSIFCLGSMSSASMVLSCFGCEGDGDDEVEVLRKRELTRLRYLLVVYGQWSMTAGEASKFRQEAGIS